MNDETLRLDKWLWHARFFKSRTLAAKSCNEGNVRVNGTRVSKAHHQLKIGDVLTFSIGARVRVVEVLQMGTRRGPAPEAQALYDDQSPPPPSKKVGDFTSGHGAVAERDRGAGRPTKRDRRITDRFREGG
ncbi:MAG: RNA-binding S4 domain-containing protein [Rhodospirillales bacterium]|nr:RNA-binding S4 domain-containing protein [Rhodospirillales bacterium]